MTLPFMHTQKVWSAKAATETINLDDAFKVCSVKVVELTLAAFEGTIDFQGMLEPDGTYYNIKYIERSLEAEPSPTIAQLSFTAVTGIKKYLITEWTPRSRIVMARTAGTISCIVAGLDSAINILASEVTLEDLDIVKWGATTLTGRDISLDLKTLSDASVTGVLKSIGDIGAGSNLVMIEGAIKTAVEILDNVVSGNEAQVDVVAALPAGTNLMGKVGIDQTTPGTTNAVVEASASAIKTAVELIDDAIAAEAAAATKGIQVSLDDGIDTQFAQCNAGGDLKITLDGETVGLSNDSVKVDDAAFTPATDKVTVIGAEFDGTTPDSVDEGDAGALRMSANRTLYSTIRDAAGNERGANVDTLGQLGVVEQSGDAIKTAVQIMDDWDESDRAKVNPIVGQAGIAAGTGIMGVAVPRVTLATDDPAVVDLAAIEILITTIDTVLDNIKTKTDNLDVALSTLETISSEITKWGGTALTGRDISLDLKALVDDSIKGLLKSLGDITTGESLIYRFGETSDAVVAAGATGTIHAKLRRVTQGLEDLKSLIVLAAGTALIGKVGIDQTTPGTTNATYTSPNRQTPTLHRNAISAQDFVAAPAQPTVQNSDTAGSLAEASHKTRITCINDNGETTACAVVDFTVGAGKTSVVVTITRVAGAKGYNIFFSVDADPKFRSYVADAGAGATQDVAVGTVGTGAVAGTVNTAWSEPATAGGVDCAGYDGVDFDCKLTLSGTTPIIELAPIHYDSVDAAWYPGESMFFTGTPGPDLKARQKIRIRTFAKGAVCFLQVRSLTGTTPTFTLSVWASKF